MSENKALNFVTFFPKFENIHILKDVGMIPSFLASEHNYHSKIVTIKNGDYSYIDEYALDLEIEFIEGDYKKVVRNKKYENKLGKEYLRKHAREIDILNIYHFTQEHLFLAKYYKKLNSNGIVYLKLDEFFDKIFIEREKRHDILSEIKRWYRNMLIAKIELVTCESRDSCERFSSYFNREVKYLPNGFFDVFGKTNSLLEKKRNVFLTVGRLGTKQKNTELILDAFCDIYKLCDWNLILVGSMKESCKKYLNRLLSEHEELKTRIIYKGELSDKKELYDLYQSAKVFLMPSRWENFSLAIAEAQSLGCFLILSDRVGPWREFVNNDNMGLIVPTENKKELAEAMLISTNISVDYQNQSDYAYKNFSWSSICNTLNNDLLSFIALKK